MKWPTLYLKWGTSSIAFLSGLFYNCPITGMGFPSGSEVKNSPAILETQEMRVQSLDRDDPLEEGKPTHSSILAWRIPRTEEPLIHRVAYVRVCGVWQDYMSEVTKATHTHTHTHTITGIGKKLIAVWPGSSQTCLPISSPEILKTPKSQASSMPAKHSPWGWDPGWRRVEAPQVRPACTSLRTSSLEEWFSKFNIIEFS